MWLRFTQLKLDYSICMSSLNIKVNSFKSSTWWTEIHMNETRSCSSYTSKLNIKLNLLKGSTTCD
jgi:hypothetical protein